MDIGAVVIWAKCKVRSASEEGFNAEASVGYDASEAARFHPRFSPRRRGQFGASPDDVVRALVGFDGLDSDAYKVFLFWPLSVPFTLGLTYPYVTKRQREFFVGDSRYGRSLFGLELPTGRVYKLYILAGVAMLAWLALVGATLVGTITQFAGAAEDAEVAMPGLGVFAGIALLYAGLGAIVVFVRTSFENMVWNHTLLDQHHFESRLRAGRMLWLYASNVVLLVVTLGLFVPWARVRMAQYRAESLTLLPGGPLVSASLAGGLEAEATGAELTDAMDLDFGL